ncbi:MAG: hypothetical protein RLZZ31_389 [Actinomycetota bacterium]|jgi:hypothetical protein
MVVGVADVVDELLDDELELQLATNRTTQSPARTEMKSPIFFRKLFP